MSSRDFNPKYLFVAWFVVALLLFVAFRGSLSLLYFWWLYFTVDGDSLGGVTTGYALIAGPLDYLPLVGAVVGLLTAGVYLVARRRSS